MENSPCFFRLLLTLCIFYTSTFFGTTYTVTSTADGTISDGVSLRWAITQANNHFGADQIYFDLGPGVSSILLETDLPSLQDDSTTIDGFKNGAYPGTANTIGLNFLTASNPLNTVYRIMLINYSGNLSVGLRIVGNNNTVKGLVLPNFGDVVISEDDVAISISGNKNNIVACFVGMLQDGVSKASGKTGTGILITGKDNVIGTGFSSGVNLISGLNQYYGIRIKGANCTGNKIKGNIIGLQKDATTMINGVNQNYGIFLSDSASNNTIGGTATNDINIISGNGAEGIMLNNANFNFIQQNVIGCTAGSGYVAANTQSVGVTVLNSYNNDIGGNYYTYRNVISGNNAYGIHIKGTSSTANIVRGNYIGINRNGNSVINGSTQFYGVLVDEQAYGNIIGGLFNSEGNVISGNVESGVCLNSSAIQGNVINNNFIGPQSDGLNNLLSNNQKNGVYVLNSPNNSIGVNLSPGRNTISANLNSGISITGINSTGNLVKGNYIGPNKNSTATITNSAQFYGVYIDSMASANSITDGNIIASNVAAGIYLGSKNPIGNAIKSNSVGVGFYSNTNKQACGILVDNSPNNVIGGNAAEGNSISFNNTAATDNKGVYLKGVGSSGTTIKGNYISNQEYGVYVETMNAVNIIGSSVAGEGNTISLNSKYGIFYTNCVASNQVIGNIIGLEKNGINATYPAQGTGIGIFNSQNILIGGGASSDRNIISNNASSGILISGPGTTSISVFGNYIGTTISGTTAVASGTQACGIKIDSSSYNYIGGSFTSQGNVISGNNNPATGVSNGIMISNNGQNNTILNNIIGLQFNASSLLSSGTQLNGILINNSKNNFIGNTLNSGKNIISGNNIGVALTGSITTGNLVKGNYIGLPSDGITYLTGNVQICGVNLSSAVSNTIGGVNPGEGNLISGNRASAGVGGSGAVQLEYNAHHNLIVGNSIGLDANGNQMTDLYNQDVGILITASPDNIIGGSTIGHRNVISGNRSPSMGGSITYKSAGIYISNASSSGNVIKGNYIGISTNGTDFVHSGDLAQYYGVRIFGGVNNLIGGPNLGEGNVISGNMANGITLESNANSNTIIGNIIGLQQDGQSIVTTTANVHRQDNGIYILNSNNNIIGGETSNLRNVISGNEMGIRTFGQSQYNRIMGNYIGVSGDGISPVNGNFQGYGIYLQGTNDNIIGSRVGTAGNIISYNLYTGIVVSGWGTGTGLYNRISGNLIFGNPMYAIANTSNGNNEKTPPIISYSYPDVVGGTSAPLDTVEVFKNNTGLCQDASVYVGTAIANSAGTWSLSASFNIGDKILATGTATNNNTSMLACTSVTCPAVTVIGSRTICPNGTTTLTASGATSYTWEPSMINSASITYTGTGTLTLSTLYANTCAYTSTINVSEIIIGLPGNIDGLSSVCQSQNGVSYSVSPITNADGYNWILPVGATITSGSNTNSITVNYSAISQSGNISVSGTNLCGSGDTSLNYFVNVNPLPSVLIMADTVICSGKTTTLTALGASTYSWNTGSVSQTLVITPTITTTYTVNGIDDNGCENTATESIIVNQMPNVNITVSGTTLQANQNNASYQWVNCNNNYSPFTDDTLAIFNITSNGDYAVIIDLNGCIDTSSCVNINTTLIQNTLPKEEITIFPNPFNRSAEVIFLKNQENVELELFDVLGKKLKTYTISGKKILINRDDLPDGTYFLMIHTPDKYIYKRVVIGM